MKLQRYNFIIKDIYGEEVEEDVGFIVAVPDDAGTYVKYTDWAESSLKLVAEIARLRRHLQKCVEHVEDNCTDQCRFHKVILDAHKALETGIEV